jgi:hypothetical protein
MRCRFALTDEEDLATENNMSTSIHSIEEDIDTEDIQPEPGDPDGVLALSTDLNDSDDTEFEIRDKGKSSDSDVNSVKTEFAVPKQTNSTFIIILVLVALILGSGLAAMQFPQVKNWVRQNLPTSLQRFVP